MPKTAAAQDVLDFWFDESKPEQWYKKDPAFDETIRSRFEDTVTAALSARLDSCCLLYTSPSPRDVEESRMPSSA